MSARYALKSWLDEFFPNKAEHVGSDVESDLLALARHIAQNRQAPRFFPFEGLATSTTWTPSPGASP